MSTLIIGSVALVTAVAYWQDRLGYSAIAVLGGIGAATFLTLVALPNRAWNRLAGTDTLRAELGQLHAEGALLRARLPWVPDDAPEGFAAWATEVDAWFERVQERLAGTPWLGTLLSPVVGFRTSTTDYSKASRYKNALDDKLERLSQIMASLGGRL